MEVVNLFASQFSKFAQATTKAAFELRFNSIQKGIINRLNKEIDEITDDGTIREISELQDERNKFLALIPKIQAYQYGLITNKYRLAEIQEDAQAAMSSDADSNAAFSSDEVTKINTAKDQLAEKIRNLKSLYYPGFYDGSLVLRMRQSADRLDALTAETGIIDASGTTNFTNDNRPLLDLMSEINQQAINFETSTGLLVGATNQMLIDTDKKVYELQADLTALSRVELAKQAEEVKLLKARYSNLLSVISLTFEVSSGLGDMLSDGLDTLNSTKLPDKGSIMNLFI